MQIILKQCFFINLDAFIKSNLQYRNKSNVSKSNNIQDIQWEVY